MVDYKMPCLAPRKVVHDGLVSDVRCGRCRYCRIRRKQAWVGRLRIEASSHNVGRFLTLTYRDNSQTVLDPAHVSSFLKRYRTNRGSFRYFCAGEFGERTGRPHYHVLMFSTAQEAWGHVDIPEWPHGYAFDGSISTESIGYVAGYALKNLNPHQRAWCTMSRNPGIALDYFRNFGKAWAQKHVAINTWPAYFAIEGRKYPLTDGAMVAFQYGYLNEGGLPPVEQTPDERHMMAMSVPLGTLIQNEKSWKAEYDYRRTIANEPPTAKNSFPKL